MTEKIRQAIGTPTMDLIFKGIIVFIVPWSIWTTSSIYEFRAFVGRGDRFSSSDGHRLEKTILEQSLKVQNQIYALEKEFSEDFVRHSEMEALLKQWGDRQ